MQDWFREFAGMLYKEFLLEWKQKYAFNGLLLYVFSMVVVVAMAFVSRINPLTWNILYWLIVLFVAINAVAKSFMGESTGQQRYLYTLASPSAIILAKILYNALLLILVSLPAAFLYQLLSQLEIADPPLLLLTIVLGCAAFSANLTLVSAIAARAENRSTLLAVLSFPLIIPILLTLIKASRFAIEGLDASLNTDNLLLLLGMTVVLSAISLILFPFIWRS